MDIAIIPTDKIPARFYQRHLYEEDFVIATRARHPFAKMPTLTRYCEMQHLVVSLMGDPHGFVDEFLAQQGHKRRIALTVPNFMFALAIIAETDLIAALPRRFAAMYGARFGVVSLEAPLPLPNYPVNTVASTAAMMDAGVAWLFGVLQGAELLALKNERRSSLRKQRV